MRICLSIFLLFSNSVACGLGHSMIVVDRANVAERLDQVTLKSDILLSLKFTSSHNHCIGGVHEILNMVRFYAVGYI